MQGFAILSGALLAAALLGMLPIVRGWWQALFSRPWPATLLIAAVTATQLGVSTELDLHDIAGSYGGRRLLRASILAFLLLTATVTLLKNPSRWRLAGPSAHWMTYYAIFAMLSAIWSLGPLVSLYKGFEVLSLVLIVVALAGQLRTETDVRWLLNLSSLILLYLVLTVITGLVLYPHEALAPRITGFISSRGLVPVMHHSSQGGFAALLAVSALVSVVTKERYTKYDKVGAAIVLIIGLFLLLICRSRTQLAAGTCAIICVLMFGRRFLFAAFAFFISAIALVLSSDTVLHYIYRGQTEEHFESLTGRLDFWPMVIDSINEAPLLGKGFWATQRLEFGSGSVDNTYLETFVGLGAIGLLLILIAIAIALITLWKTRPKTRSFTLKETLWMQVMAFFVILLLRSVTSPTFASFHALLVYYMIAHVSVFALHRMQQKPLHLRDIHMDNIEAPTQHNPPLAPLQPRLPLSTIRSRTNTK